MLKDKLTFEESLAKFEEIIKSLESKTISLEEAVKGYTEGIEISKQCHDILKTNEELVIKQMTESGLEDFNNK